MSIMGYRSYLLRSVITLVLFYSTVGVTAFYAMGPRTLEDWLTDKGIWNKDERGAVTALNAARVATEVVVERLQEVWPWALAGAIVATLLAWGLVGVLRLRRHRRARSGQEYRGISVTISEMPRPQPPEAVDVLIEGLAAERKKDGLTKQHDALLKAILGYLKANEDAYCGSGHEKGVFDHTLGVMEKTLKIPDRDPLLLLLAAAHDMGKATSYTQNANGEWVRIKYHDKEGARVLSRMDEWWQLPMPDRTLLLLATKHNHTPEHLPTSVPDLTPKDLQRLAQLIEQMRTVDGRATSEEKSESNQDRDIGEIVVEAFLESIKNAPFQRKRLAKGVQAIGWRDGDRLYVLERAMREFAISQMDALTVALLNPTQRNRGKVSDFTSVLLDALEERGWLVKTAEIGTPEDEEKTPFTLPNHKALWRIQSGTHVFNGIYIVELPQGLQHIYPEQTLYQLSVLGPLHGDRRPSGVAASRSRATEMKPSSAYRRPLPSLGREKTPVTEAKGEQSDPDATASVEIDPLEDSGEVSFFAE